MGGLGIDLGTANTVVGTPDDGIVLNEPSFMLVRTKEPHRALAIGTEARSLVGRTPIGITPVRPLRDGVIVDLESARAFVTAIVKRVSPGRRYGVRPKAVISVPAGATPLERRALLEVGHEAGLRKVGLVPEPVAGALGCGINPLEARAHLVVDIGGGTSEITAICFGGILSHRSCRLAGDELTNALYHYLRSEHNIVVGELTAERAKLGAPDTDEGQSLVVEGRDAATGRARFVTLETEEIVDALRPTTAGIVRTLTECLEDLPPQAIGDVMSEGLLVIGGGAMLRGLSQLLEEAFGFPVKTAERPLTCVAEGATACLVHPEVVAAYSS
ncbi:MULTISPECIES: rod shape-determining protein [Rhodococcus]|uniref:Cell shape-determining protein MreB n=2 Tax=Rhodococcus TaxID=1827 RepID=A0A402CDP8_RHOWR|nr:MULTISPECIES: rod shape-determining protein [Rhodococcus]KAF0964420.1 Rod shape-determining protein MreB [Rhodococcus sp. T7]MBV6757008.1 rod shape-determining protein [Rhodococcus opacus]OUS95282.1 rod shape-determining protein [Rhodococcus sp. NCIMB 12038]QSE95040.1 rod shape-determining protein [Rhodococcus pseudokoreensis]QYB04460.1 rod shape-determining protein [Rhodococcus sp. USK10]